MADLLKGVVEVPTREVPTSPEESPLLADEKALGEVPKLEEAFLEEESPTTEIKVPNVEQKQALAKSISSVAPANATKKDEAMIAVEKVLEDGLGDFYATLPPEARERFKKKGEEASTALAEMVRNLNMNFKKALELVRDWLLTIPKVNKFFLEQEAKIKVDLISAMIESRKENALKQP